MSDNKSQLATFRIEPELWESFKAQARKNGKTASDVLIDFVQSYVEGGGTIASIASAETPQLDNLDSRIDEKVVKAIAPLQNQIEEIRGAVVDNSIQTVIESLTSRLEQLEQRLQSEESEGTGEPISAIEPGIVKNQSELTEVLNLISRRQLDAATKKGIEVTAKDGSVWRFEGREPGGNGAKTFRCVSLGKIQGEEAA